MAVSNHLSMTLNDHTFAGSLTYVLAVAHSSALVLLVLISASGVSFFDERLVLSSMLMHVHAELH